MVQTVDLMLESGWSCFCFSFSLFIYDQNGRSFNVSVPSLLNVWPTLLNWFMTLNLAAVSLLTLLWIHSEALVSDAVWNIKIAPSFFFSQVLIRYFCNGVWLNQRHVVTRLGLNAMQASHSSVKMLHIHKQPPEFRLSQTSFKIPLLVCPPRIRGCFSRAHLRNKWAYPGQGQPLPILLLHSEGWLTDTNRKAFPRIRSVYFLFPIFGWGNSCHLCLLWID